MRPTIATADSFLVEKFAYWRQPKRGDIVAFSTGDLPPFDKIEIHCQRIIGIPGDLLEGKFGRIYVNGCPLSECKPPVGPIDRIGPYNVTPNIWLRMEISSPYRKRGTFLLAITSPIR
jgi:signal peptidase I